MKSDNCYRKMIKKRHFVTRKWRRNAKWRKKRSFFSQCDFVFQTWKQTWAVHSSSNSGLLHPLPLLPLGQVRPFPFFLRPFCSLQGAYHYLFLSAPDLFRCLSPVEAFITRGILQMTRPGSISRNSSPTSRYSDPPILFSSVTYYHLFPSAFTQFSALLFPRHFFTTCCTFALPVFNLPLEPPLTGMPGNSLENIVYCLLDTNVAAFPDVRLIVALCAACLTVDLI